MSSTRPGEEVSSTGGLQGQNGPHLHLSLGVGVQKGGARDLSAQRGVIFNVAVSLVLLFSVFIISRSGLVGVVALCHGVGLGG